MSILKIARLGHPILYQKASLIDNISESGIKKLIHDMSETMLDYKGIGLAAPQVHVSKQIIIFRILDNQEKEKYGVTLHEVFPKTVGGQSFSAGSNDAYQTLDVEFAFRYWDEINLGSYGGPGAGAYST